MTENNNEEKITEIEHLKHLEPTPLYNPRGDLIGAAASNEDLVRVINNMIDAINTLAEWADGMSTYIYSIEEAELLEGEEDV